ncbi:MAG: ATP-binding protein [Alphaproteobacteria bacterium]|nr:ATP-binding protein [Alphaproteobacteria bacterium]
MSKIYLICGFLGAGKTTISQQLAHQTDSIHLNPDKLCFDLFSKQECEQNWDECFSKTISAIWEQTAVYAQINKDVIIDMGFWTRVSRDTAKEQAKILGADAILYYIYAPDEILKKRLSLRQGKIAEYNLKQFENLKKKFEEPTADENVIRINNF